MTRNKQHITKDKIIAFMLIIGGFLIVPMAVPSATAVGEQSAISKDQKAEKSDQMRSVTGTVLKLNDAGEQIYYLDIDGDGTEDYRLEFRSESQRSAIPNAGERITIKGYIQGKNLEVYEVKKQ